MEATVEIKMRCLDRTVFILSLENFSPFCSNLFASPSIILFKRLCLCSSEQDSSLPILTKFLSERPKFTLPSFISSKFMMALFTVSQSSSTALLVYASKRILQESSLYNSLTSSFTMMEVFPVPGGPFKRK